MSEFKTKGYEKDELSAGALEILKTRPSLAVSYGGTGILIILIVFVIALSNIEYVKTSTGTIVFKTSDFYRDSITLYIQTNNEQNYQIGEQLKLSFINNRNQEETICATIIRTSINDAKNTIAVSTAAITNKFGLNEKLNTNTVKVNKPEGSLLKNLITRNSGKKTDN